MTSNREKLRAMSKKNAEEQTQITNQPTLISDMANQLNNEDSEQTSTESNNTVLQLNEAPAGSVPEFINEPVEDISKINIEEPILTIKKTSTKASTISKPVKKASEPVVASKLKHTITTTDKSSKLVSEASESPNIAASIPIDVIPAISIDEKYTGREITVTLLLSAEVNEFLIYNAIDLRVSVKHYFKELMVNAVENSVPVEDELTKIYRKVQHDTIKKSVLVNEDLKEAIKEAAIKYHMKYTPFMAYVIDKARLTKG